VADLLEDLTAQTYPSFEVWVIDDHSTFPPVLAATYPYPLQVLRLADVPQSGQGKKAAITLGVAHARGEVVVCTDGDCRVGPGWLASHAAAHQASGPCMVCGPVTFHAEKIWFSQWQTVEFASLIGSAAGCIYWGIPTLCNGANLSYARQLFLEVGGYAGNSHIASGDDEFLMHRMHRARPGSVAFLAARQGLVHTQPSPDWHTFYQQRKRWGSKWPHYQYPPSKWLAVFIFAFHASTLLTLLFTLAGFFPLLWFLCIVVLKGIAEFALIAPVLVFSGHGRLRQWIVPVGMVYPFYAFALGLAGTFSKSYAWKGRQHA
jgi:cellulose synthase/poly-beta-1,6-N-acetylglucosamine synthase-like glycosyltransferase